MFDMRENQEMDDYGNGWDETPGWKTWEAMPLWAKIWVGINWVIIIAATIIIAFSLA